MLKPAPETVACEIVTFAVPPFDNVIVCELLDPVDTLGKAALIGFADNAGCVAGGVPPFDRGLDAPTTPAHAFPQTAVVRATPTINRPILLLFWCPAGTPGTPRYSLPVSGWRTDP